jgi:RsiW-degrading membrane proteinase PrsW (M82 family)
MSWLMRSFPEAERERAQMHPVLYVLGRAWLFAGSFTFAWLLASVFISGWSHEMEPRKLLFVSSFAGLLSALLHLGLIRRSVPAGTESWRKPIT